MLVAFASGRSVAGAAGRPSGNGQGSEAGSKTQVARIGQTSASPSTRRRPGRRQEGQQANTTHGWVGPGHRVASGGSAAHFDRHGTAKDLLSRSFATYTPPTGGDIHGAGPSGDGR